MSLSISFDLKKLERRLNQIEKVFLKEAAEKALKQFGFESRKTLADAMRDKYQTATNYTLSSPRYKVEGSTLRLYINDDQSQNQSAAKYLFPTDRSDGRRQKPIKPTTLAGFLQGKYGTNRIPVPVPGSRAGRQFINKAAARAINDANASFGLIQRVSTDNITGGIRKWRMKSYKISPRQQIIKFKLFNAKPFCIFWAKIGIIANNAHFQTLSAFGNNDPDITATDQTQGFTSNFSAHEAGFFPFSSLC